jgi:hypothetical protein
MDMRVAILALSLLGIAVSHASAAQMLPDEVPAFSSAVPAIAMNSPAFSSPQLVAPTVTRPGLRRSPVTRNATASGLRSPRVAMGATSSRALVPGGTLRAAQHPTRSLTDHLLTGVVALLLIGHQLRRKHRVLRPHPFTT